VAGAGLDDHLEVEDAQVSGDPDEALDEGVAVGVDGHDR
jgi:hypothetical protein